MPRQYIWRHKCPYCAKPYAKTALWIRHIKACKKNPANNG